MCIFFVFFFFQAEDGIRDDLVTGVQTCALPILPGGKGVKRIPVEGLKQGHASPGGKQDDQGEKVDDPDTGVWKKVSELTPETAGGATSGRAVVLIPNGLPDNAGTVEVLFHLHGFTPGMRGRGTDGRGAPEDVAVAKIAQQLGA